MTYNHSHPLCPEHPSDCVFEIKSFREGDVIENRNLHINHLVFCIEGYIRVRSTLFQDEILCAHEVMFIPHQCECRGTVMSDATFLVHRFNNTVCDARKCILHYLSEHHHKNAQIYCSRLQMHPLLWSAVGGIIDYITHQTIDPEIWVLKHRELIWIFTHHYPVMELQAFFHPIRGEQVPFRTLVMSHYPKANTSKELATLCCMSLSTFRRTFKMEFDKPVYQWLIEKRCEGLLFKLSLEYITLADIIHEYNFSSAQHLTAFCKQYMGDTPVNLRKRLGEKKR